MTGEDKQSWRSKILWAAATGAISAIAGAIGVWIGARLVDEITDAQLERVLAKPEVTERVAKAAAKPVAGHIVGDADLRTALLDAMAEDGGFVGPAGGPGVPIGAVVAWPTDQPFDRSRWHECDGSEIEISGSDDPLARALGTLYGSAADLRHVKLPDFRGCFLRGNGTFLDPVTGTVAPHYASGDIGTPQPDSHTAHLATQNLNVLTLPPPDGIAHWYHARRESGTETRPVNYAVRWIIRVR